MSFWIPCFLQLSSSDTTLLCQQHLHLSAMAETQAKRHDKAFYNKLVQRLILRLRQRRVFGRIVTSDLMQVWNECEGRSVISGNPAETIVFVRVENGASFLKLAPVTLAEARALDAPLLSTSSIPPTNEGICVATSKTVGNKTTSSALKKPRRKSKRVNKPRVVHYRKITFYFPKLVKNRTIYS